MSVIRLAIGLGFCLDPACSWASTTTTYSYDALGRLTATSNTGSVNNGATTATTYDAADNRTAYTVSGSVSKVVVVPLGTGFKVIPIPDN